MFPVFNSSNFKPNTKRFSSVSAEIDSAPNLTNFVTQQTIDPILISSTNRPALFDNSTSADKNQFNNGKYLVSLLPDHLKVPQF